MQTIIVLPYTRDSSYLMQNRRNLLSILLPVLAAMVTIKYADQKYVTKRLRYVSGVPLSFSDNGTHASMAIYIPYQL